MKKTKQGLRDLNDIPAAKVGRKLELPENQVINCPHRNVRESMHCDQFCRDCGEDLGNSWDRD